MILAGVLGATSPAAAATLKNADALAGTSPGGVTGKVMDVRGGPLAGGTVILRQGERFRSILTDEQGEYCFCRVEPAGNYVFEIEKEGFTGFVERDFRVARS